MGMLDLRLQGLSLVNIRVRDLTVVHLHHSLKVDHREVPMAVIMDSRDHQAILLPMDILHKQEHLMEVLLLLDLLQLLILLIKGDLILLHHQQMMEAIKINFFSKECCTYYFTVHLLTYNICKILDVCNNVNIFMYGCQTKLA